MAKEFERTGTGSELSRALARWENEGGRVAPPMEIRRRVTGDIGPWIPVDTTGAASAIPTDGSEGSPTHVDRCLP